jgi:hypothetical protein
VYFGIQGYRNEQRIYFATLKMTGHALVWWESYMPAIKRQKKPLPISWEAFKMLLKNQCYSIGYKEDLDGNISTRERGKVPKITLLSSRNGPHY